jgi:hypothetical protein
MPKTKTKRRGTRRIKKTRRVMPRRKKTMKGGYDPATNDNSFYPTRMNGYPTMSNYALPDPKYIDHVTVDR